MTCSDCREVVGKFVVSTLIFVLVLPAGAAAEQDMAERVDAFMSYLVENLDVVPGYAIAVASLDSTILASGYGTTAEPGGHPMDADTQVYIASSTKSLTGLAVASLASKGSIDLDIRINEYVPELGDSAAGKVTLRQLLSHTHGLAEDALTWRTAYSGDYSDKILLKIVKSLRALETHREFSYSNTGYVVASIVLEHHFGKGWKDIVAEEVLTPAGMSSTTAYVSALGTDFARPHSWFGVKNKLPMSKRDNTMHAAGGHFSTANDMGRWLQAQLSDGKIDGRQIFVPGLIDSTHRPNATVQADFYTYKRQHYGIGWYEADHRGYSMYHHFGSFSGYRSHVSFIPELRIGVAVLINDASRPGFNLPDLIANYVYDLAAGAENPEFKAKTEIAQIAEMIEPLAGRIPPVRPRNAPVDEARYAGRYSNEDFGTIELKTDEGEIVATFGNLTSRTTYKEDGAIRMELVPYEGTLGTFVEDSDGQVTGFQYRGAFYRRLFP